MSKAGPSTTSTQNATLPAHITSAQKDLLGRAQNLTSGFTGAAPNFSVMGLTPDQLLAGDLTRQTAMGVFSKPQIPAYDVFGMGKDWNTGQAVSTPTAQAGQASVTNATAAQLDPNAIGAFMNPYIQNALNPAMDRLAQQNRDVQANIGANAAASHMFGGSREAVARSLQNRDYGQNVANTAGNMLMQGWNQAAGLASGNTDRSQQTALSNANAANQIAQSNAGLTTQANMQGAALNNQNALNQQNLMFQGSQNDANRFLQGLQLQGNLDTQNLQNKQGIINMLNQMGGQTRAVGQQALDAPFSALQKYQAALQGLQVPQSSTSTSQTSKPVDILGTLLGIGGMAFGGPAGGAASGLIGNMFGSSG